MRRLAALIAFVLPLFAGLAPANAYVVAKIDKSSQSMQVYVHGKLRHSWKVSTARAGYRTPVGSYRPTRMHRMWRSRKYNMSPMPHSVFFRGGYAIHGTYQTRKLGRRASHGCIRLAPGNARRFFNLVRKYGRSNTSIRISG